MATKEKSGSSSISKNNTAGFKDAWTSVTMARVRLNGLRVLALKDKRRPGKMLDLILEKAGVPQYTDAQYAKMTKGGLSK